ncbi:carboxypeptidase B-like protein [Leptotrombidium deliense]|uniref:Carboxypeptidase B-like protein n=1 Tax=Leptotrombidium deliense TaxID=299467 RepID=A0A443SU48_9ACAR|nr:carboxypeptidase B-like protein [Leptotrombidium deliense]
MKSLSLLFLIVLISHLQSVYSASLRKNVSEKAGRLKEQLRSLKIEKPFEHFRTFEEIERDLKKWAKTHPELITLGVIGQTYHKRNIYSFSIADNDCGENKPAVLIECGMHAREWVSPAICFHMINELLDYNSKFSNLLASFDFHMIPMLNPDGYVYTWTNDRLWRKNRSPQAKGCVGVDLNRNFDIDFCVAGSETDPCSHIFCGPKAFSELESQAFRDYATQLKQENNLKHSFHIHSYGQMITYPYGYKAEATVPNAEKLEQAVYKAAMIIKNLTGTEYTYGQSGKFIYEASGGGDDWAMMYLGLESTYCIENQDTGDYGFMLSNRKIKSAASECTEIMTVLLQHFIED